MDGELQIDNVLFVATTNYPEKLDRRLVCRPSRFDIIRKVGMPTASAREVYLQTKNKRLCSDSAELADWVKQTEGFYVNKVNKNSGAEKVGIEKGDIIVKLDDTKIASSAEMATVINTKRPNDIVKVSLIRDGKNLALNVPLTKKELIAYEFNGIEFEDLDANDKKRFNLKSGIKIKEVTNAEYAEYAEDLKGSIVTRVDNMRVSEMESLSAYLAKKETTEKTHYEIIAKNGQKYRFFL